jgi:hypothetical protein
MWQRFITIEWLEVDASGKPTSVQCDTNYGPPTHARLRAIASAIEREYPGHVVGEWRESEGGPIAPISLAVEK